jgi:hypothetical protein
MPRRARPRETKRDWRWWANILLNGAVVVSMVFGSVLVFTGLTPRQTLPTIEAPTVAPTIPAPAPTPTPKALLENKETRFLVETWFLFCITHS